MSKKPDVISTRPVEFSNNGILDFLTGAPAPKLFLDNLRRDISKSKRRHQDISIVTVKLLSKTDKQIKKNIPKKYNQLVDFERELLDISKIINLNIRSGDFYSRFTENGFWLCIQGELAESEKIVERLRSKLAEKVVSPIDTLRIDFRIFEWNSELTSDQFVSKVDLGYFI